MGKWIVDNVHYKKKNIMRGGVGVSADHCQRMRVFGLPQERFLGARASGVREKNKQTRAWAAGAPLLHRFAKLNTLVWEF
jgi:hypothetical protein